MPPHRFLAPSARGAKSENSRTPGKIQAGINPPAREETAFPAALIYHKSSSFDSVSASSFSISCFWVLSDNSSCLITCTSRAPHFEGGSFGIIWSVSVPRKPRGEEQAKKVDRLHRGSVERCCTYTPERATHGLWLLERRRLITQALTEGATKPSISRAQQQQQQRAVGTLVTARCARP